MAVACPRGVLRAWLVMGLVAMSSLEMAFLKSAAPGNQQQAAKGLADLATYVDNIAKGLVWPGLAFGGLAIVVVGIMLLTGNAKAQTIVGFIVLAIGVLVCAPGIMA